MAPDKAESLSDPFAPSDAVAVVPDSSPLRVSLNTQFESGIPPARERETSAGAQAFDLGLTLDRGVQRMEAALANQGRTEVNLGLLARGLKHLSASAQAARVANTELMYELDELRTHLTRSHEEEQALRYRMSQLERLLDMIRSETSRERAFMIEEQDRFLIEIITDHERQLSELQERLRQTDQSKVDRQKLEELTAQRDQAREYATRCERERDLAWQELAASVVMPKTADPPADPPPRSPSGTAAIGSISLRTVSVPASSPAASAAPETERSSRRSGTSYSLSGDDVSE